MQMLPDKKHAQIDLQMTVDAAGLELLIRQLSELRAAMEPGVPLDRPHVGSDEVSLVDEPSLITALLKDGRVRFWLRHVGQGWLAFNLSHRATHGLRAYLQAKLPSEPTAANFFGSEDIGRNSSH